MSDDEDFISTWTRALLRLAPDVPEDRARVFVHDLYFAARRAAYREGQEADLNREE